MCKSQWTRLSYHLRRWLPRSRKKLYAEIDQGIAPLVARMNATGLCQTVASCEGHGSLLRPPYVYFKANVSDVALLEYLIREATWRTDSNFREAWVVEGRFDHELDLTFILYCPTYHRQSLSLLAAAQFFCFRKGLESDLSLLADLVEKWGMLKHRDSNKPKQASGYNHNRQAE